MTLILECKSETTLPIEVDGITSERLTGLGEKEIARQSIWIGRHQVALGELFQVRGQIDENAIIIWQGNLQPVHWIGAGMTRGQMIIESPAGRHVGSQMTGGTIVAGEDVGDFAGAEMTGGTLKIRGNAGDLLGGHLNGSRFGMNRGTILVEGNAGRGVGQAMRRGTIAIGGNAGQLCGWNMLAGSIIVLGDCEAEYGAGMVRGTIVIVGSNSNRPLPTFARGGNYVSSLFPLMVNWLDQIGFPYTQQLTDRTLQMYHGDLLNGGRGEILLAV